MNLQHLIVVNKRQYEIKAIYSDVIIVGKGKQFAFVRLKSRKLVFKHCLNGKFQSKAVVL
jgi:hypothetical protein